MKQHKKGGDKERETVKEGKVKPKKQRKEDRKEENEEKMIKPVAQRQEMVSGTLALL